MNTNHPGQLFQPYRVTPLYHVTKEMNADFYSTHHWLLPWRYTTIAHETDCARAGLVIVDRSASGKLILEGEDAASILTPGGERVQYEVGTSWATPAGTACFLRPDLVFLHTPPGSDSDSVTFVQDHIDQTGVFVTLTDLTEGYAEILLIGPRWQDIMSRLCSLDLSQSAFPPDHLKQTRVAKIKQIVMRHSIAGLPACSLLGDGTFAEYLWRTVIGAGGDLGLEPMGDGGIEELISSSSP